MDKINKIERVFKKIVSNNWYLYEIDDFYLEDLDYNILDEALVLNNELTCYYNLSMNNDEILRRLINIYDKIKKNKENKIDYKGIIYAYTFDEVKDSGNYDTPKSIKKIKTEEEKEVFMKNFLNDIDYFIYKDRMNKETYYIHIE